jgi:glycosyltransferase involved in cell wall biosynthesis
MQSWSVGILCLNEVHTIKPIVQRLRGILAQMTDTYEIIIVDDGSTDGTGEVALELEKEYPEVRVITHAGNKGIGMGFRSVFANARYENMSVISGDGQFDMTELLPFPEVPKDHFVSFYRKENTTYTLFRNILSYLNKKLNKMIIGVDTKDVNWAKIYKKADIDSLDLQLKSSLIESEIFAKLIFHGKKVIEVESKYLPRTHGQSKGGSAKVIKKAVTDIMKLIKIMSKYKADQKAKRLK